MRELALLFLKLGTAAFGGPAAHIAMMEEEVVKRRQWLTREHFLDLLGVTNLIPGPNSTEMAIHIGYVKGGWRGLIVAGICFILPAVIITLFLAYLYSTYGAMPSAGAFLYGVRPAVIAIIFAAVFRLGKPLMDNRFMVVTGLAVAALKIVFVDEIVLLFGGGLVGLLWAGRHKIKIFGHYFLSMVLLSFSPLAIVSMGEGSLPNSATLTGLGLFFLKIGSILYGSGYVLVAFLQGGLVDARHWLTQSQLLDAVAVGQCTPGPVLSTATFIGYVILGVPGAMVATAGIFLPSFVFVSVIGPFVARLRNSPLMRGFLDGVNAASLGLMLAVTLLLAQSSLVGLGSWIIFLAAVSAVLIWNINSAWIVIGSAAVGWLFFRL